jgi:hypothetical protein
LVEDETGGEPTGAKRFVRSSLRSLAERLGQGSPTTVGRLLRGLGFSPRVNVKRFTGPPHPDRDKQFRYLRRQRRKFQKARCPAVSVDAKKKELVGNFRNAGRKWSRRAEEVNAHDFPQDAQCRAAPYGIYDTARNAGHVCVGISTETSEFAVDALRQWWRTRGKREYPGARKIFIEADAGGSNGYRRRLWKRELQRWANADGRPALLRFTQESALGHANRVSLKLDRNPPGVANVLDLVVVERMEPMRCQEQEPPPVAEVMHVGNSHGLPSCPRSPRNANAVLGDQLLIDSCGNLARWDDA